MNKELFELIEKNLLFVLREICEQPEVGKVFLPGSLSYDNSVEEIREWIEEAGEYGIAYESIISMLESYPFKLTGKASIKLLEVGLLMQFKTDGDEDKKFDKRV